MIISLGPIDDPRHVNQSQKIIFCSVVGLNVFQKIFNDSIATDNNAIILGSGNHEMLFLAVFFVVVVLFGGGGGVLACFVLVFVFPWLTYFVLLYFV